MGTSLAPAHVTLECCEPTYNGVRSHTRLGQKTQFAFHCSRRLDPALRYAEGSGPASVAITDKSSKSNGLGDSPEVLEVTVFREEPMVHQRLHNTFRIECGR